MTHGKSGRRLLPTEVEMESAQLTEIAADRVRTALLDQLVPLVEALAVLERVTMLGMLRVVEAAQAAIHQARVRDRGDGPVIRTVMTVMRMTGTICIFPFAALL